MTPKSQMRSNESVGKRLLNVREAAQYLGLQADTVYKKARLRELPSVKVGRALRFDVVALNNYVERHAFETFVKDVPRSLLPSTTRKMFPA